MGKTFFFSFCNKGLLQKKIGAFFVSLRQGGRGEAENLKNQYFWLILSQTQKNGENFFFQFFIPKNGFPNKNQFSSIGEINRKKNLSLRQNQGLGGGGGGDFFLSQ